MTTITITQEQAQTLKSMLPDRLYSVNLGVVEEVKCSREQCYEELCEIAFIKFKCLFSNSVEEKLNQTDMDFQFDTTLDAFEFMETALKERPDAIILSVEVLDSKDFY